MSTLWPSWRVFASTAAATLVFSGGLLWWIHRRRGASSDERAAKAVGGSTLATHPETYSYLQRFIGETASERDLRLRLQAEPRAQMMGAPDEAFFLRFLLAALGAKRVVEVGVFRGTTTLQLAHGVGEGGVVHALDVTGEWLRAGGRAAWEAAGVADRIRFTEAPALESMERLLTEGAAGTIDFVFIDADKSSYRGYYEASLQLLRRGGIVAVDNVLWHGRAERPPVGDADSQAIHDLNLFIRDDARVAAVMLGIADGVYFARKL